jgi:glycerol uptake facilitator-like aquaporin
MTASRRLLAEAVGTAMLLATVVGSGIVADRLAVGDGALALLCNSIATGAILVVLVSVFGQVSGAHLNPAVTLAFALRRELGLALAIGYVIAQLTGAVLGTWTAHLMFNESVFQLATKARTGSGLWFSEAVATFGLVLAIFGTQRWKAGMVPIAVGLYITSAYWFTASTSFANPAVTIARSLTETFAGIQASHAPAFIVAQLFGALVATLFCGFMFDVPPNAPQNPGDQLKAWRTCPTLVL